MLRDDLQHLNQRFALRDHINFIIGPGDMPVAEIHNAHAIAAVALQGGHVISFQPWHQRPVLWVSAHSHYAPGQSIRGGIPVCWPWFANHPTDPSKPSHGFARTMPWHVLGTAIGAGGRTELRLGLIDTPATRELWPHDFQLELVITVGPELQLELIARNNGDTPMTCTGALHSYFGVSDVAQIAIHGLEGCTYVDKVDAGQRKVQHGPVTIRGEIDQVYLDTVAECIIADPLAGRQIRIAKSGSRSTVIWNPGELKARNIPDFGAQEYTQMVCVETANALDDAVQIAPHGSHRLKALITVEPLD